MENIKKSLTTRFKNFADKVADDNLFLLSSSVSYYSALGFAPFLLIILAVASLIGQDIQGEIISRMNLTFSPEVGEMVKIIFKNVNKGVNIGSLTGVLGITFLISTASVVFLQFRYAFDVIYGRSRIEITRSPKEIVIERIFAMVIVIATAFVLIISFSLNPMMKYFFGKQAKTLVLIINFFLYIVMFTGIHYFTPTIKPKVRLAIDTALLSTVFFILGNALMSVYLKRVAVHSVYGVAGTLLVFLIWTYYSSFTVFLSIEVSQYLKKIGKIH